MEDAAERAVMFEIITDTSCNLPTPMLKKMGIEVIPFTYIMDGKVLSCTDTETFDGKAFFDQIRAGKRVQTSQITPHQFRAHFEPVLASGKDLIFVSMSSGISASCSSAQKTQEELQEEYPERKIFVVDSVSASLAEGMVVLKAYECKKAGMSIEETKAVLEEYKMQVCQVFTVGNLNHLKRTGRLSAARAIVGTLLRICPVLIGDKEGKIVLAENVRGRKNAIKALADKFAKLVADKLSEPVCIAHADCREDADFLAECLKKIKAVRDVMIVMYEPVTGSHVGPGTLALFYEGEKNARLQL